MRVKFARWDIYSVYIHTGESIGVIGEDSGGSHIPDTRHPLLLAVHCQTADAAEIMLQTCLKQNVIGFSSCHLSKMTSLSTQTKHQILVDQDRINITTHFYLLSHPSRLGHFHIQTIKLSTTLVWRAVAEQFSSVSQGTGPAECTDWYITPNISDLLVEDRKAEEGAHQ